MLQDKARFDGQLPIEQKQLFEYATTLGDFRSLTEFIFSAAEEKAKAIVQEHKNFLASETDKEIFFNALINPPEPNKALRQAAERYKKKLGE